MLYTLETLHGAPVHASDSSAGSARDFLFDDHQWTIRYIVINTGSWLFGRRVLIAPPAIEKINWEQPSITVTPTKSQIEQSPPLADNQPVSRQWETEYAQFYGYPLYWSGGNLWGTNPYPQYTGALSNPAPPLVQAMEQATERQQIAHGDPHLRSSHTVKGYHLRARDGSIGHVSDFLVDADTWRIHYLVIDTRNWWPGKHVLLEPAWITAFHWETAELDVDLTRASIKSSPAYDPHQPITAAYAQQLQQHYAAQSKQSE